MLAVGSLEQVLYSSNLLEVHFLNNKPYQEFGILLKNIRQKAKESVADVCGAVEADLSTLKDIEAGKTQPEEDLVLLLISHFALKDEEALKMWELAGYEQEKTGLTSIVLDAKGNVNQKAYVASGDARILYTDMVHVSANKFGIVVNFLQVLGVNDQPMAVSRIGMSQDHAKSLIDVLQKTLEISKKQQSLDKPEKDTKKG